MCHFCVWKWFVAFQLNKLFCMSAVSVRQSPKIKIFKIQIGKGFFFFNLTTF